MTKNMTLTMAVLTYLFVIALLAHDKWSDKTYRHDPDRLRRTMKGVR